jgi:1-acyl-sn-glycerol-3-phosphate acyltransferase
MRRRRQLHTIVALDWMQSSTLRLLVEFACSLADWPVVLRSEQFRQHTEDAHWAYDANEARQYLRWVTLNAVRILRSGSLLVIFPEGYPNVDIHVTPKADLGSFLPFRPGFVKMAELAEKDRQTHVAIIPTGLIYTLKPRNRCHIKVRYGPALYLKDFASSEQLLLAVEEQVQRLSGAIDERTDKQIKESPQSGMSF